MKYQAHKGVSTEYPENTMPAFTAAVEQGYDVIELDVGVTKDQQMVLLHDDTINRTARYSNGSQIQESIRLADLTYNEALKYDFGIGYAKKFAGTRISLLSEVLEMAAKSNIQIKIDNKYQRFTDAQRQILFDLVRPYSKIVIMTCNTVEAVKEAVTQCPEIAISYDGLVSEESLMELALIAGKDRLTAWVPYENMNTSWVTVPFVSQELAEMIKRYAQLGIWILSNYDELAAAEKYGADVIETNGQIKPIMNQGILADMHTHSENSHDSVCKVQDMCESEILGSIKVMAVTDHCDVCALHEYDIFAGIYNSFRDAGEADAKAEDRCRVLRGIEIGESFWYPEAGSKAQKLLPYDVIIGSVHCIRYKDLPRAYSTVDFSKLSMDVIYEYLELYFEDVQMLLDTVDFDILAHLTCPLRYITGKYGISVDIMRYERVIREILGIIIKRGIALEVNTSSYGRLNDFMPGREILKIYREMGGYLITIGSDAHAADTAAIYFTEAVRELKEMGFHNIFYFEERRSRQCSL